MISKSHRFIGHNSVSKVRGRPNRGQGFSVYVQPSQRKTWRAAVVVSKKVHKSAVVRNRIRRRIYESLRLCDKDAPIPALDIVVVVHDSSVADLEQQKLLASIDKALHAPA